MSNRMKPLLTLLGVAVLALGGGAWAADDKAAALPAGWFVTESTPKLYEAGLDTQSPCEGNRSAYLRSMQAAPTGYGTFMQAFGAGAFRGKRLRFSAVLRTEDVQGWAGLWMRVEGEDPKEPLAFDNMQSRALAGTTGCTRYDVVLDVPAHAKAIMAGLMLSGTGKAWIGAVRFETVDGSVAVTNLIGGRPQHRPSVGRVNGHWFTAERADTDLGRFVLQPDGTWKDALSQVLTQERGTHGDTVRGQLRDQALLATVKTGGPATLIQGTWGSDPLSIELGAEKLVLKLGLHERSLVREDGRPQEDGSCIRYGAGDSGEDFIDVCGLALSKSPPVVPLIVAFLSESFRASGARTTIRMPRPIPDPISQPGLGGSPGPLRAPPDRTARPVGGVPPRSNQ